MWQRNNPLVDVLIRGWDNRELTHALLKSLPQVAPELNIIYVDNGSDTSVSVSLLKYFPHVTHVRLPFNHGSVRAINVGLQLAELSPAPYILLLDNDTEIPQKDASWLRRWLSYFADETVGAAGAVSDYTSGYQHVEAVSDRFQRDIPHGRKDPQAMPLLVSFALMLRKSAVEQVGLFDEQYEPGLYEDYDYAVRLREAGYKLVVADSVWIHHKGSQTFGKMNQAELFATNSQKFIDRWGEDTLRQMGIKITHATPV